MHAAAFCPMRRICRLTAAEPPKGAQTVCDANFLSLMTLRSEEGNAGVAKPLTYLWTAPPLVSRNLQHQELQPLAAPDDTAGHLRCHA